MKAKVSLIDATLEAHGPPSQEVGGKGWEGGCVAMGGNGWKVVQGKWVSMG